MLYIFTNIIGSFVLDQKLQIIDQITFQSYSEFQEKKKAEEKLRKKHQKLDVLPEDRLPQVLSLFREKELLELFYKNDLAFSKEALKNSINEDHLIIQAIDNINELDKIINTLSKRLREWYSLHFPEIVEKIDSHEKFVEIILKKDREELMREFHIPETMGADFEKYHTQEMKLLAAEIIHLFNLRSEHEKYLKQLMSSYCPNILELAGTTIGAKLIELGRGLKHLAMLPASTIQLLGAEKALFRHLKTGSRSPKYGIIINHPLIQEAGKQDKGKMSRSLADKLSLCARLDYFHGELKAPEYRKELEKILH